MGAKGQRVLDAVKSHPLGLAASQQRRAGGIPGPWIVECASALLEKRASSTSRELPWRRQSYGEQGFLTHGSQKEALGLSQTQVLSVPVK